MKPIEAEIETKLITGFLKPGSFILLDQGSHEMAVLQHIYEVGSVTPQELKTVFLPVLPLAVNEQLLLKLEKKGLLICEGGRFETATHRLPEVIPHENKSQGSLRVMLLEIGNTLQPLDCTLVNEPLWWEKREDRLPLSYTIPFAQRKTMAASFAAVTVFVDKKETTTPVRLLIYPDRTELHVTDKPATILKGLKMTSLLGYDFDFESHMVRLTVEMPESRAQEEPLKVVEISLRGFKYNLRHPLLLPKRILT